MERAAPRKRVNAIVKRIVQKRRTMERRRNNRGTGRKTFARVAASAALALGVALCISIADALGLHDGQVRGVAWEAGFALAAGARLRAIGAVGDPVKGGRSWYVIRMIDREPAFTPPPAIHMVKALGW